MKSLFIITGPSASGKTTISNLLSEKLGGFKVLSQDNYCFNRNDLLNDYRFHDLNHELPSIIDHNKAFEDIKNLLDGQSVLMPKYKHSELRSNQYDLVCARSIIYEGIHTFYDEKLIDVASKKIFLTCDYELLFKRRLYRDNKTRSVSSSSDERYFYDVVLPSYKKYTHTKIGMADIVVDASKSPEEIVGEILNNVVM